MKKITRRLIIVLLIVMVSLHSKAQDSNDGKLSLYVHGSLGVPLDKSTTNAYSGAFGLQTGVLYRVANLTHIGAMTGYSNFPAKSGNLNGSLFYIPVKASVRQYLPVLDNKVFGQGNVGVAFIGLPEQDATDTRFGFDIYGGVQVFDGFEVAVGFDAFKEIIEAKGWTSQFTLKVGYRFGLN
jgi:hypothetical protein